MIKKLLKGLGIIALIFSLTIITIRLNSLEDNINDSFLALQEQIEILQRQSTINDLSLSSDLTELARSTLKIAESIKEVDYNKIIRGDVLVMGVFGSGAGTVIKKTENEMYVLTCYHVIDDIIKLNEGGLKVNAIVGYSLGETGDIDNLKSFVSFSAEVIKSDEENDLALLKVNYFDPNLVEIKIAEQEPQKGDTVYSVGSPLGLLRTVSKGILANKIEGFYLTDGTTTFGNSGGGLYNKDCELIGVPSNVMGYASGLGKDGKETFVPESSLGLSRNLPTIKAFLEGVI